MTVIDRVENSQMERMRKVLFFLSIGLILFSVIKYFNRSDDQSSNWGWWIDLLILFIPGIYFIYYSQTKLKQKAGQFIEWNTDRIVYNLEGDMLPKTILNLSIVDIAVQLHSIDITDNMGQLHKLSIKDFADYKTRIRIKNNFQRQNELCLNE